MLSWTLFFFVCALLAGVLGFTGLAAGFASLAKILFVVFLALLAVNVLLGRRRATA